MWADGNVTITTDDPTSPSEPCEVKTDKLCKKKDRTPRKAESINELLDDCPKNQTIGDNLVKAWKFVNDPRYKKIVCSISGGSDSDIVLDIIWKCDKDNKVDYVWYDTGLEYQATKDHLAYLQEKYGIVITSYKAIKPIPVTCKQYGQPFISKFVSEQIYSLQSNGFKFEDRPFEELVEEYPKVVSRLRWWCNKYKPEKSQYNISRNKWLKEFLVQYPPTFKISSLCCKYAKKNIVHKLIRENHYDLEIAGIRMSEGGIRAASYKNCFDERVNQCDSYRPLFWYTNKDKTDYEDYYAITHSRCYTEYGFLRTGCCCCPFGKDFEHELEIVATYEPKLYKAVNHIFGESYAYTRKYREFCRIKNEELKESKRNNNR